MKNAGNKNYRKLCDGKPLKGEGFKYTNNDEACMSHNGINILFSIEKYFNNYVMAAD